MDCRVLVRFIGEGADLALLWQAFMEKFPEAELPSEDSGDWYSVDPIVSDEYECRFEELPETELLAMDGNMLVEDEPPEDVLDGLLEMFPKVFAVFKWSSVEVGVGCGVSEGWGEFIPDRVDDYSDEKRYWGSEMCNVECGISNELSVISIESVIWRLRRDHKNS